MNAIQVQGFRITKTSKWVLQRTNPVHLSSKNRAISQHGSRQHQCPRVTLHYTLQFTTHTLTKTLEHTPPVLWRHDSLSFFEQSSAQNDTGCLALNHVFHVLTSTYSHVQVAGLSRRSNGVITLGFTVTKDVARKSHALGFAVVAVGSVGHIYALR